MPDSAKIGLKGLKAIVHLPQWISRQFSDACSGTAAAPRAPSERLDSTNLEGATTPRFTDVAPVYAPPPALAALPESEPPEPAARYGWFAWRDYDAASGKPTLHVTGRFRPPKGYSKCRFLLMEDLGSGRQSCGSDSGSPVLMLERFIVPAPVASAKPPVVPLRTAMQRRDGLSPGSSAPCDAATPEPTAESTIEISFEKQEPGALDALLTPSPCRIGTAIPVGSSALHRYVTILPEGVTVRIKNV